MKVLWVISFILYANGASISDINEVENEEEQQFIIQQVNPRPAKTVEEIKKMFCGKENINRRLNMTRESPSFHETGEIKYEEIDVRLDLSEQKEFFGDNVDVDFNHNVTDEGKFNVKVDLDISNREENYKLKLDGMIKGKPVTGTGKLTLRWEKVGFVFYADADEVSTNFNNVLLIFGCENPSVKMEGLDSIVEQIEKERFYAALNKIVIKAWTEMLRDGKISTQRKNVDTCLLK